MKLITVIAALFSLTTLAFADIIVVPENPSCERPMGCPDVPYFDLIKVGETTHPYYRFRDNRYLCFYIIDAKTLKRLKGQTLEEVNDWVLSVFNGVHRSGPFKSSRPYYDQYFTQMRLFSDCKPAAAMTTYKIWKQSGDLMYIDVKHTPDRK